MTLETIYYIGQTISVLAILASLIFVGIQIRQNTAQAKADAADKAHQTFNAWYENVTPDIADLVYRASQDFDSLKPAEKFSFIAYITPMMVNFQEVHAKWQDGSFPEDRWQFWDVWMHHSWTPLATKYWEQRRQMFSEPFRKYIDDLIATRGSGTKRGTIGAALEERYVHAVDPPASSTSSKDEPSA